MLDHILGRPSPTIRRSQILLVLTFWLWRLYKGDGARPRPSKTITAAGPRPSSAIARAGRGKSWAWRLWVALVGRRAVLWIQGMNDRLRHFTPYQLVLGTLTVVYAFRHIGDIFGLGKPLADLYTRSYYRATYVNTALDAGFATAMTIRPKWLKDICSVLFGVYYLIYASAGDEVLRKFRALCTVEMLRVTWEKTNNPYIRLITAHHRPRMPIIKHVLIPRPSTSSRANLPPVKAMLFFSGTEDQLAKATQLVVDYPGGGFIAMGPECHEERLRRWAKRTGKPVLGVDYGKAPEYPYPWAIEEGFDAYRTLMETKGSIIGIKSGKLDAVLTGDSAGGNICATIMLRILEHPTGIPRPVSMILSYPCLDFNFTSWMSPANLKVLRTEQSETHIPGIAHGKDHMRHKSPLSVVDDVEPSHRRRQQSWGQALSAKLQLSPMNEKVSNPMSPAASGWKKNLPRTMSSKVANWLAPGTAEGDMADESGVSSSDEETVKGKDTRSEAQKSLRDRVKTPRSELPRALIAPEVSAGVEAEVGADGEVVKKKKQKKGSIGTNLTMTSRVGYFQDRIITPSMMRAMAILYIGPRGNPDFETDYYISPLLSPPHLLAHFPPVYLICGERDPFVDDTVIFAGKIREAKRARRAQAEAKLSKSAKFGESLRMSASSSGSGAVMDHILRETDDDWVSMRIIEGWGHGFMQMTSLMREVDSVLVEMADWIDESFARHDTRIRDAQAMAQAAKIATPEVGLSPVDHMPPSSSTLVKPVGSYKASGSQRVLGGADLGAALGLEAASDEENGSPIMFTPKTRKKNPPPSKFNPVPRRPSKERLHRVSSVPRFDVDETGSSGEAFHVRTPPLGNKTLPVGEAPRATNQFAVFGSRPLLSPTNSTSPSASASMPRPIPPVSLFAPRKNSTSSSSATKPTNSLVAAAVAGARAASPALAAAGLVPQSVGNVSEAELMRRRRMEAVFGVADSHSNAVSDDEG